MAEEYAFKQVFSDMALEYSDDILRLYRKISEVLWGKFENAEITKDDLQFRRFSELFAELNINMDAKPVNDAYVLALGAGSYLIDGAEEICKTLTDAGKVIYIVTNGVSVTQKMRIGNSAISKYISGIFVSEDTGYQKPRKEYFDYVFSRVPNLDLTKTIIIGDSLTSDIKGGIQAGIDTCWFNKDNRQNTTMIKPTYKVTRLMEISRLGGL
jgi:YjjG family noncanonical pyrimidine nucleotidase